MKKNNSVSVASRSLLSPLMAVLWLLSVSPAIFSQSYIQKQFDYLNNYNIAWHSQSLNSAGSMPLNAGAIGCNVWVENGDILLYVQHTGSYDKNGEYLKTGRFRVHLSPNPFGQGATFVQELKLREGCIEINGELPGKKAVRVKLWVEVKRTVVNVDVLAEIPVAMQAAYESWRYKDVLLENDTQPFGVSGMRRMSIYDFHNYQKDITKKADVIKPAADQITWYHNVGNEFNAFQFALYNENMAAYEKQMWDPLKNLVSGGKMIATPALQFEAKSGGIYGTTPYKSWKYKTTPSKNISLSIFEQNGHYKNPQDWEKELQAFSSRKVNSDALWQESIDWWKDFWTRSYIYINAAAGQDTANDGWITGRNFQLFRYQLGGNTYGNIPTKFNGGNITYDPCFYQNNTPWDPDYRRWGGFNYTAANMKMVYWEYLKNGDFEAMLPMFDLYKKALPNAEMRTKVHFGHEGCSFSEQTQASGLPVASQYGFLKFGKGQVVRTPQDRDGELANYFIKNFYHGQVEFAFMILEYYRFSGRDISAYMPFILSVIKFYDQHFQMYHKELTGQPLDEKGKLVIYPSTAGERHPGTNPADAVAGLKAVAKLLLILPASLLVDTTRNYVKSFQARVPEQPVTIVTYEGKDYPVFVSSLNGALTRETLFHTEWPYNLTHPGTADWPILLNTEKLGSLPIREQAASGIPKIWSEQYPALMNQIGNKTVPQENYDSLVPIKVVWSQVAGGNAAFTRDTKAAVKAVTNRLASNKTTRYPTFWWGGDWGPDHNHGGPGSTGLQEMLMQTFDNQIILFPAWPINWDVDFKLFAPNNTTVECSLKNGVIEKLEVLPKERAKDVAICSFERAAGQKN